MWLPSLVGMVNKATAFLRISFLSPLVFDGRAGAVFSRVVNTFPSFFWRAHSKASQHPPKSTSPAQLTLVPLELNFPSLGHSDA